VAGAIASPVEGRAVAAWLTRFAALALLALMAVQLSVQARDDSLTFDEVRYIQTGVCGLTTRTIDLDRTNPPAHKLLAGVTVIVAGQRPSAPCDRDAGTWYPREPNALRRLIVTARVPIIALSLLLAAVVFLWATAWFGRLAGLVGLALVSLEPTLLGHGHIVTGDLSLSLAVVSCLASHWAWTRTRRRRWLFITGLALGWGLLSKGTAALLVPVLLIIELAQAPGSPARRPRHMLGPLAIIFGCAWALVCLVYLPFQSIHGRWPAPLSWVAPPSWFESGIIQPLQTAQQGHVIYLNGVIRPSSQPFATYFLEALVLKTTLGLLVLMALATIWAAFRRDVPIALYLWLPVALFVATATARASDVGVRYVLPVYPLMVVIAASLARPEGGKIRVRRLATAAGAAAVAASGLAHAPNGIGYFNELAGSRPEHYLSDSNIDWGQDAWRLRDWWESEGRPRLSFAYFGTLSLDNYGIVGTNVYPGRERVRGLLAVSITRLTVIGDATHPYQGSPYRDLEDRVLLARIGTSIEIFDLGGPPLAQ